MSEDTGDGLTMTAPPGASGSTFRERRLRRVKSTSRAEEIVTEDEKIRRAQPDRPIHKPKDSLFSWTSGFAHYEGVMNWGFLLLTMGGIRLGLENLNKYGVRVDPTFWVQAVFGNVTTKTGEYPTLNLILLTHIIMLTTLGVEKLMAQNFIGWNLGFGIHLTNILTALATPMYVIRKKYEFIGPVNGTIICSLYSIMVLKMWSYIQVNQWCREHARHMERRVGAGRSPSMVEMPRFLHKPEALPKGSNNKLSLVQYPGNLGLRDLYYFWLAPTLCYELNFPKMQRIRKLFLLRRVLEVIVGTNIALGLVQQWIIPSVVNSLIPFTNMDVSRAAERLLKLAVPNHLIWLTWFYLIFHSLLNTIGEVMQFADREFYRDWWNAENILQFWKLWNLPVHRFCVRHIFKPILKKGYTAVTAQVVVFFFSAFFHEYLVSVPLQVFKTYAFTGMFMQIPLIFVSEALERRLGPRAGNICVWISLIIGQPLVIMMYYHDFVVEHYGAELINFYGKMIS